MFLLALREIRCFNFVGASWTGRSPLPLLGTLAVT